MRTLILSIMSLLILFGASNSALFAAPNQEAVKNEKDLSGQEKLGEKIVEDRIKPLELNGEIKESKMINGKSNVSGMVSVKLNQKKTDKDVKISYKLFSVDDNKHTKFLETNILYVGKLEKTKDLEINLKSLDAGQYQLMLDGESKQNESSVWGDSKVIYFSVGDSGLENGLKKKLKATVSEDTYKGGELYKTNASELGFTIDQFRNQNNGKSSSSNTSVSILTANSISGTFQYNDRTGNIAPLREAKIIVYARDEFFIYQQIATALTDSSGFFSATFDDNGDRPIKVAAYTINDTDAVADGDGYVYGWIVQLDVFGGGNFGTAIVPPSDYDMRAIWAFNDIGRTRAKLTNAGKHPGSANVLWYMGSTEGAYYNVGGEVHLKDGDADSDDTTIHELGHNYMYNVYNGNFPVSDCPSPHFFSAISGTNCAWIEGWADFLPLYINNDSVYSFSTTEWTDVETRGGGTYDFGDRVEGNVAGALWDLYDTSDDGSDTRSYPFMNIYTNMWFLHSDRFRQYWDHWVDDAGYDPDALGSIDQNTMAY
jgi:hypothetical protein